MLSFASWGASVFPAGCGVFVVVPVLRVWVGPRGFRELRV